MTSFKVNPSSRFLNDGSNDPPKLRVWMNLGNLDGLPSDSVWLRETGLAMDERLIADGFEGVQQVDGSPFPADTILPRCGSDRVNVPDDADPVIAKHASNGAACVTLHVGWGWEDDPQIDRLVESVLTSSKKYRLPVFIETHRATITQDLWRTVQIANRFPDVRFNGDFSHYYCGQEMVYGDWETKLAFMQPIFDRVGFMHGRISSPGCMQVSIGDDIHVRPPMAHGVVDFLSHFRDLWTRAMRGFLQRADPGDVLIFAPELLAGTYYYARLFRDQSDALREESDRYAQALLYAKIARECFANASRLAFTAK